MNELNTAQRTQTNGGAMQPGGFNREMGLIPWWAYGLAAIGFVCMQVVMHTMVPRHENPPPYIARIIIGLIGGSVIAVMALLIGYVNRDSKRRGMNSALWTTLVIFVPNALGFILYFLVRQPLQVACGHCGAMLQPNFRFCPKCSTPRFAVCGHCNTPTHPGDLFCNNCGRMLHEPMK
jgi:hypothetical protein